MITATELPTATKKVPSVKSKRKSGYRPFRFGAAKGDGKTRDGIPGRRPSGRRSDKRFDVPMFRGSAGNHKKVTDVTSQSHKQVEKKKASSKPTSQVAVASQVVSPNSKNVAVKSGLPPTGLVTTFGGTTTNGLATTIHETSVIGTYINGKYAQILLSTSRIYQPSTKVNLNTVKPLIQKPSPVISEKTKAPSFEDIFAQQNERNARLKDDLIYKDDPYADEMTEEDLQRSGSELRPSFHRPAGNGFRRKFKKQKKNLLPMTTFRRKFAGSSAINGQRNNNKQNKRPLNNRRKNSESASNRVKLVTNRKQKVDRPNIEKVQDTFAIETTPTLPVVKNENEETLGSHKSKVIDGTNEKWVEVATIRAMHEFRVGAKKNTRFVTFTKTFTHNHEPTVSPVSQKVQSYDENLFGDEELSPTPLFENILETATNIKTLHPINIGEANINAVLRTTTESFIKTETLFKTSVLPILSGGKRQMKFLTQTYMITKMVTAIKTIPPKEAFDFIPENSLNEYNGQLLAEGTENEHSLLPGEREYSENDAERDSVIADVAGEKFDIDALDAKLDPKGNALQSGKVSLPGALPAQATPALTPAAIQQQLAYLQMMNPFALGGVNPLAPRVTVTSSPVTITTDVTTTTTRVLRVIFNARPIFTTLSTTEVVRTTITTYSTATVTASPQIPFAGYPFQGLGFAGGR